MAVNLKEATFLIQKRDFFLGTINFPSLKGTINFPNGKFMGIATLFLTPKTYWVHVPHR